MLLTVFNREWIHDRQNHCSRTEKCTARQTREKYSIVWKPGSELEMRQSLQNATEKDDLFPYLRCLRFRSLFVSYFFICLQVLGPGISMFSSRRPGQQALIILSQLESYVNIEPMRSMFWRWSVCWREDMPACSSEWRNFFTFANLLWWVRSALIHKNFTEFFLIDSRISVTCIALFVWTAAFPTSSQSMLHSMLSINSNSQKCFTVVMKEAIKFCMSTNSHHHDHNNV